MSDGALLRAFVDELILAGVREAVVCPGSRSTPLALALRTARDLRVWVLLDERAAGFFALGMARTARRPVLLLATSGTATVEFAPAVVEAQLARVPLVVLTADRPPELRDRGAPQTIDQHHLYGRAAKWYTELPLFDGNAATSAHVRSVAGRAVATAAAGPAGPVQINVPFRDPLLPDAPLIVDPLLPDAPLIVDPPLSDESPPHSSASSPAPGLSGPSRAAPDARARPEALPPGRPFTAVLAGRRALPAEALAALAGRLRGVERGLIVAGPGDDPALPDALASLARVTGFPIVADPLSGLRSGPHDRSMVVVRGDQLARPGAWIESHRPQLVLRTGAMPTSAPLGDLIARAQPDLLVLDGDAGWRESALVPATFIHADPAETARDLARLLTGLRGPGPWAAEWLASDAAAARAMDRWLAGLREPFEGAPFACLADALPDGSTLWVGNSMPVRDLDAWLPSTERAITVRSNRGANGIDGVVSAALGSAAVGPGPVALVVGDLSFLHDLNALVAARLHHLSATIVLINNDGGGIFSFLPQATAPTVGSGLPEHYEELFGTPHGIDPAPIVEALGGEHRLLGHDDVVAAVVDSVGRPGVRVLELRTDRARNVQLHREVAAAVQAALTPLAQGAAPATVEAR